MDLNPQWLLNNMWTNEAHFSRHSDVDTQNSRIQATLIIRAYLAKPLYSLRVTISCGFMASYILDPIFFEEPSFIRQEKSAYRL